MNQRLIRQRIVMSAQQHAPPPPPEGKGGSPESNPIGGATTEKPVHTKGPTNVERNAQIPLAMQSGACHNLQLGKARAQAQATGTSHGGE